MLIHANFLFANPSLLSAGWSYPKALVDTYVDEVVDFDPPLTDAASAWERCRCGRMCVLIFVHSVSEAVLLATCIKKSLLGDKTKEPPSSCRQ